MKETLHPVSVAPLYFRLITLFNLLKVQAACIHIQPKSQQMIFMNIILILKFCIAEHVPRCLFGNVHLAISEWSKNMLHNWISHKTVECRSISWKCTLSVQQKTITQNGKQYFSNLSNTKINLHWPPCFVNNWKNKAVRINVPNVIRLIFKLAAELYSK